MFRLAVSGALVLLVSILVGWLTEPPIGVALFALVVLGALIAYLRAPNPDQRERLRGAAHERHPHGAAPGERHVLVVANEVLSGEELRRHVAAEPGERVRLDVLAPVLTSRVHYGVSDVDAGLEDARARLERSLRWAREQGIAARGEVGDPSPTTAIEDELRDFGADEVIVVTHPLARMSWQERREVERLRAELDVPVTHIESPGAADGDGA